jgi:DNA-binding transcriptional LysR family regulator
MLELVRSFLTVLREGSLNRAAETVHITQSSLTRQMQSLEGQIGAPLLERQSTGVKPTALGLAVAQRFGPVLEQYDTALADLQSFARGKHADLKIGYLGGAAAAFLTPALTALRAEHPEARVKLLDLSPGEQIAALHRGEIDLALIGQEGAPLARDFYAKRLATLGVCAVLPSDHALAGKLQIHLSDLANEAFIGATDAEVPGRNQWIIRLCRKAGYRPRFVGDSDTVCEALARVPAEGAVLLLPDYLVTAPAPGVTVVPLAENSARWELLLLRQRGRASLLVKSMEALLFKLASRRENSKPSSGQTKSRV